MTRQIQVNVAEANRLAGRLRQATEELGRERTQLMARLVNGDDIGSSAKVKAGVKVTIGVPPFEYSGARADEIVAKKLRGCGDAYEAIQDGLRAMSTVMERMAAKLGGSDELTALTPAPGAVAAAGS